MKKLLGIVVLGLLWCSFSAAGEMNVWKKKIKMPKDIMKGYINDWRFCCNIDPETKLTPDYAFKFVNKSDGHPVRLGEQSLRIELRRGDCGVSPSGYDDCAIKDPETGMTSERNELTLFNKASKIKGTTWHTYSIFLPKDFLRTGFEHITMGQLHGDGDLAVAFNWNIGSETLGYEMQRRTACFLPQHINLNIQTECSVTMTQNHYEEVITGNNLLGKWHDIVFNVKWTKKQTGYLKQWINGKLVYHYQGNTETPGETTQAQFGIYRGPTPESPKEATQIAYYDQIRFAKKCKKLKLEDLGYSCEDLESQQIDNIDKIIVRTKKITSLSGKYKLSWHWVDIDKKTNKIIKDEFIVSDLVRFENGKFIIDKLGSSNIISDKYRNKITFTQGQGEKIIMDGKVNLDYDGSDPIEVILSPDENNKSYAGTGVHSDENKDKSENIKLILEPLN